MNLKCGFVGNLLVVLVSCVIAVSGQDEDGCNPGVVRNVHLSGNSTLSWDPPLNEDCEILHYVVSVRVLGSDEQFEYIAPDRILDVGHLTPCLRYYFEVSQVSTDNVTGSAAKMNTITPPPSEANLALDYLTLTTIGTTRRDVRLQWSLEKEWVLCSQRYRLVIVNEATGRVNDVYTTSSSSTVTGLTPCAPYTFTVRALFTLEEEGPPRMVRHTATAANTTTPVVEAVSVGANSAALTLNLQTLAQNWCPITSINIDGEPNFSSTFPVVDQENRNSFKANLIGLQADSLYYLKITATNSAGTTGPVLLAIQTSES